MFIENFYWWKISNPYQKKNHHFQKNHFKKYFFFDRKKKVEKIFESLYRCKIFRRRLSDAHRQFKLNTGNSNWLSDAQRQFKPCDIHHFQKNMCHFQKLFFFDRKKKVEIFFESLYRCKIFRRFHFSHPWSDLTSLKCSFGHLKIISLFWLSYSQPSWYSRPSTPHRSPKNIFSWKIVRKWFFLQAVQIWAPNSIWAREIHRFYDSVFFGKKKQIRKKLTLSL